MTERWCREIRCTRGCAPEDDCRSQVEYEKQHPPEVIPEAEPEEKFESAYDLEESRRRKEEGIARVEREEFSAAVGGVVNTLRGKEVTGEDIRRECGKHGIEPHHLNAWGGVIHGLVRCNVLDHIGYRQAQGVVSHAREIRIYRVV